MFETINRIFELARENKTFVFIVIAVIVISMLFSLSIIFHKIKQKFWKALIPIYNVIVLLSVLEIPIWMVVVLFIPFVNFIGAPFLVLLIGWQLGQYCHKGILMRLGLMFCPPLFYPILSATYINIDGEEEFEPVEVKEDFSLNAVEIEDVNVEVSALSLNDMDTISKIAPPIQKVIEIPKQETVKPERKEGLSTASVEEVEDLNAVLPTADDLTFDYNRLYQNTSAEKPKETVTAEEKIEESEVVQEENPVDYNEVHETEKNLEEEKEEEVLPVIHDIVLEDAEQVENLGPIPINKRYDFQHQSQNKVEEKIIPLSEVLANQEQKKRVFLSEVPELEVEEEVIEPAALKESVPEIAPVVEEIVEPPTIEIEKEAEFVPSNSLEEEILPMMAVAPDLTVAPVAEIEIPDKIEELKIGSGMPDLLETPVENTTRIDQMMSMNITEPGSLPVGVLLTEKKEERSMEQPVEQVAEIPQVSVMKENPTMTREEAMGFRNNFFSNTLPGPSMGNGNFVPAQQAVVQQPVPTPGYPMPNYNQPVPTVSPQQQRIPNGAPLQQNGNGMINSAILQQNPTAIFQVNSPNGGSLLRPIENGTALSEKNCPVCGVKLKQDCPICIMCGYKF